jgi:hypothetical protein
MNPGWSKFTCRQLIRIQLPLTRLSVAADTVPLMSGNAASWAATASNKFREVARSTENPTTKLLAEGLTALAEAVRELDQELRKVGQRG